MIITRGEQGRHFSNNKFQLGTSELEKLIGISPEKISRIVRSLDKSAFLSVDEDDGVSYAEVSYRSKTIGSDIIPLLVDCLGKDEKLLQGLFIEADFTLLD